ncbi:unnamed protein product [Schistosoma mattheei]|uniref:Uncharacterized protein n=1 Tax=Schistosoma mattheei TaxID=31246 RepID=A0A183PJ73_9TREM|nr:unnamed protein product [Schistosoma mattheei]
MGILTKISVYEYLLLLGIYSFGLFIFMSGLLPNDPATKVDKIGDVEETYKIDKFVMIVVDALRVDFLFSPKYSENWVKLRSYMNLKSATCSASIVQPPTVTLPRIKAIVSGRNPKFVDILHNVNAETMVDDNWVTRLVNHQWKIQFYGDDTWIKLFPKSFQAYEGTNSFYVDENVTRHIPTLMTTPDTWDGLILHYLGLDHIGHIEGPKGSSIPKKIREMDEVIHSILEVLHLQLRLFLCNRIRRNHCFYLKKTAQKGQECHHKVLYKVYGFVCKFFSTAYELKRLATEVEKGAKNA